MTSFATKSFWSWLYIVTVVYWIVYTNEKQRDKHNFWRAPTPQMHESFIFVCSTVTSKFIQVFVVVVVVVLIVICFFIIFFSCFVCIAIYTRSYTCGAHSYIHLHKFTFIFLDCSNYEFFVSRFPFVHMWSERHQIPLRRTRRSSFVCLFVCQSVSVDLY